MAENEERYFDLYLYNVQHPNDLVKLGHLTTEEAHKYGDYWFEMNELHDYILVIEGDAPWDASNKPTIDVKTPEWISLEYANLCCR